MKDHYGKEIIGILQCRLLYSVPNHGQAPKEFANESFYEYIFISEDKYHTTIRMNLSAHNAAEFARVNDLRVYKDNDLNYYTSTKTWPEETNAR